MLKAELRRIMRERKRLFTQQQLDEQSLAVITRLQQHPRFLQAHTVLLYHSLPDEVNTHSLLQPSSLHPQPSSLHPQPSTFNHPPSTLLLPHVISDSDMELRRYTVPDDLRRGAFGIMEPCGELFTDYERIDLIVVPGMAFDAEGHRLGRGRGYYDRLLARVPNNIYKIGLCFPFQLVDHVPTDENDISMDEVLS
ncbi:MAG: 5-formyltetrahydrofolate cyclo-ligase [Prevotella sp.]|nr:5-formyltetrahydrofolate cyclo-ligase [Prevotella sp.]